LIREQGVIDQVKILEPASLNIVENEADNAFINVVLETLKCENEFQKGVLTGKFLRLLPKEPPVLSVCIPENEMGDILKETKKGALCSSAEEIDLFFNKVLSNSSLYKGSQDMVLEYSKKNQAKKFCKIFDEVVKKKI